MAFVLLQRAVLVNRSDHQSLPSTSLRRKQHRTIGVALSHRHKHCSGLVRCSIGRSDPLGYESELEISEKRRQNLGYLPSLRHVQWEHQWLDTLQDVIEFCYKEGRVPVRGRKGHENSLARWINNQRTAKQCLDEGKPNSQNT